MAIRIGQIRYSNNNSDYLTPINNYEISELEEISENNKTFHNTIINAPFQAGVTYYLRVPIKRISLNTSMGDGVGDNDAHRQIIDIKIINQQDNFSQTLEESYVINPYYDGNSLTDWEIEDHFLNWCDACVANNVIDITQDSYIGALNYLEDLHTKHNNTSHTISFNGIEVPDQTLELIFTPYRACTSLLFQLRRVGYDYISDINRQIEFMLDENDQPDIDLAVVNNILSDVGNISVADKIGIQTAPGTLVIINGEGMRVGRNSVLELNCNLAITSVGFAAPHSNIKNFILDYIYTE